MISPRRFGAVDDRRFCFEGGSRCSFKGAEGLFVLGSNKSHEIGSKFEFAVRGRLSDSQRIRTHPTSPPCGTTLFFIETVNWWLIMILVETSETSLVKFKYK